MQHSLEQIELLRAAARRRNARLALTLAGAMGAALSSTEAWQRAARALQAEARAGLDEPAA